MIFQVDFVDLKEKPKIHWIFISEVNLQNLVNSLIDCNKLFTKMSMIESGMKAIQKK